MFFLAEIVYLSATTQLFSYYDFEKLVSTKSMTESIRTGQTYNVII